MKLHNIPDDSYVIRDTVQVESSHPTKVDGDEDGNDDQKDLASLKGLGENYEVVKNINHTSRNSDIEARMQVSRDTYNSIDQAKVLVNWLRYMGIITRANVSTLTQNIPVVGSEMPVFS